MKAGRDNPFVIPWAQTETEGIPAAGLDLLAPGALWRWQGGAGRLDGDRLVLENPLGGADLSRRAALRVGRLTGRKAAPPPLSEQFEPPQGMTLTDGHGLWTLELVTGPSGALLATGQGQPPPPGRDLWITEIASPRRAAMPQGVICFTPGTRIATPQGPRPIETLRPGDLVLTRDNGPQPLLWSARRRLTGARLHVMPGLAPIRLRAGALAEAAPEPDLIVSPQHRLLVTGPAAEALFGTPEVLVRACDLVNDLGIRPLHGLTGVTYVHLLLPRHELIWANGVLTESFHPGAAPLDHLDRDQARGLASICPDPAAYGPPVRRPLSRAEAAILRHGL